MFAKTYAFSVNAAKSASFARVLKELKKKVEFEPRDILRFDCPGIASFTMEDVDKRVTELGIPHGAKVTVVMRS